MSVRIVTDSTADIPSPLAQELAIVVVPLNVQFGEAVFRDGVDLGTEEFFRRLVRSPVLPTTSQPSAGAFLEVYSRLAAERAEIVSLHISAKLSGTLNSAQVAKESLDVPCRIELMDSQSASLGLGLTALAAARAAQAGASFQEVVALVRRRIDATTVLVFVDTLEYLQRGGRIGRAQAFLGGLLNVKPLLTLREGEIHPVERVRTRARALERLYEYAASYVQIEDLAVLHSTSPQEAQELRRRLGGLFPEQQVLLATYGPVIGTHLGPGAMGVVVCGQHPA